MNFGSKGRLIRSESETMIREWAAKVAWGVAFGAAAGIIPKFSALWCCVLLAGFVLPISLTALFGAFFTFFVLAWAAVPFLDRIGFAILSNAYIKSTIASLETLPLIHWFCLSNTVVIGSAVIAAVAVIPFAVVMKAFLVKGRELLSATSHQIALRTASEGNH